MRAIAFVGLSFLALTVPAFADDVMASRYGNTTIALDPDGSTTRLFYRADHSFVAKRADWQSDGSWAVENGKLCLSYKITRPGVGDKECVSSEAHAIGDVWIHGIHHVTLVSGMALDNSPETLAALAAAARVGNTIVAKDPDGTETRLYWRPDHSFSAIRPAGRPKEAGPLKAPACSCTTISPAPAWARMKR